MAHLTQEAMFAENLHYTITKLKRPSDNVIREKIFFLCFFIASLPK